LSLCHIFTVMTLLYTCDSYCGNDTLDYGRETCGCLSTSLLKPT
jgi:hypothetical protein